MRPAEPPHELDGPPPFLGSWPRVYGAVLGVLAGVVLALWIVTKVYS
jgi:hypothetical protein